MRVDTWCGLAASLVLTIAVATLGPAPRAAAEDTPAPGRSKAAANAPRALREEGYRLELELIKEKARKDELEAVQSLLNDPRARSTIEKRKASSALWERVFGTADTPTAAAPSLQKELEKAKGYVDKAEASWKKASAAAVELENRKEEAGETAESGPPSTLARLWGAILAGLFALGGGILLTLYEARDRLRWRLRALGSRPSGVIAGLTLTLALAAPSRAAAADLPTSPASNTPATSTPADPAAPGSEARESESPAERKARLEGELRDLKTANDTAQERLLSDLEKRRAEAATLGLDPDPPQADVANRRREIEKALQEQYLELRVQAHQARAIARKTLELDEAVAKERVAFDKRQQDRHFDQRSTGVAMLAAVGSLAALAVLPVNRVHRRRKRELDDQSSQCPRCLKMETLEPRDYAEGDVLGPKTRLVVCTACNYEIRENYIREHRLCFPTVGIRSSGKTHSMVILYDQIKKANVQVDSKIKKIPSSEDRRFDQLVDDVMYNRAHTSATVFGLPYPLTFHVNDDDPLGKNKTMVNLFDYSGELSNFQIEGEGDLSEFRRRALLCEGFTLFLDPTQATRAMETQVAALENFTADLHAMRGIPVERPIDLPIAVCISKIDLLVNQSPLGTQAVGLIDELRETQGLAPTLALIHERSQLLAQYLPTMFPGWNIERELRESFGGRYMFFPMSAVGLDPLDLGVDDLTKKVHAPYGVMEPLLWLLHMHGYCVLR